MVQLATCTRTGLEFAVKVYACLQSFQTEKEFYLQQAGTPSEPLATDTRLLRYHKIIDMSADDFCDPDGVPMPPCIVLERGESLEVCMRRSWPDRMAAFNVRSTLNVGEYRLVTHYCCDPSRTQENPSGGTEVEVFCRFGVSAISSVLVVLYSCRQVAMLHALLEHDASCPKWKQTLLSSCVQVIRNVAQCLCSLHDAGLVHRDVKRADVIWLPRTNSWTLIDFSCVSTCGSRVEPVLTLPYSAPEVLQAEDGWMVSRKSLDCWALGVLAYEMLTGQLWTPADASIDKVSALPVVSHDLW